MTISAKSQLLLAGKTSLSGFQQSKALMSGRYCVIPAVHVLYYISKQSQSNTNYITRFYAAIHATLLHCMTNTVRTLGTQ